jgi:hypothetical protein
VRLCAESIAPGLSALAIGCAGRCSIGAAGGAPASRPRCAHLPPALRSPRAPHSLHLARVFCARRLKSLYKTLKFLHGKGRYQKRKLEVPLITDARWLMIPLMSAERAWAQAMEIKKENEDRPLPHKRHHSIRRLTKAAAWAAELARFTAGAAPLGGNGASGGCVPTLQSGGHYREVWWQGQRGSAGSPRQCTRAPRSKVFMLRRPRCLAPLLQRWATPAVRWRQRLTAAGWRATCCWRRRATGRAHSGISRAQSEHGHAAEKVGAGALVAKQAAVFAPFSRLS